MLIGSGLIASAMKPQISSSFRGTIYAAGVSNSNCIDPKEFARDAARLQQCLGRHPVGEVFVYFSTCSIYDPQSTTSCYVIHKFAMEALVRQTARHLITRLPQVAGRTPNPHTLLNFLYARISRGERFPLWIEARRNIIDCEDVATIVSSMVASDCQGIVNVANSMDYSLMEVVNEFERMLSQTAQMDVLPKGGAYDIDISVMSPLAKSLEIRFDEKYLNKVLEKYYGE